MQITEIFYSLQGEGVLSGLPTVFIRTTGCNLRCLYCDTTYAYENGSEKSINQILSKINQFHCSHVCITGGEPLIQVETLKLIKTLQEKNYFITLETNGSQSLSSFPNRQNIMISMDIKTPSSNMHSHLDNDNFQFLSKNDQIKCIIQSEKDYEYAKKIIMENKPLCPVIFQPVWGTDASNLASWILQDNLPVRLGLQLHKLLWGENTRQ